MTQYDLADLTGVNQANIATIEKKGTCSIKLALKFADVLNVSLDELFGREYHRKEFNETHAKLLNDVITQLVELEDEFYEG